MSSVQIDQAFVSAFVSGNFGLPIAHENLAYKPVVGTPYAEVLNIPNDIAPFSLANTDETSGIFRIILRYPLLKGSVPAKTVADTIMAAFKVGSQVCYSGVCATVTNQSRQAGVPEEGWFKIVVTLRYRSFIGR